mgnify:FL=1
MEEKEFNLEETAMQIIANAGQERSKAFEALQAAKKNDFVKAKQLLDEASTAGNTAHKVQFELLTSFANGEKIEENVLLAHAQDHVMCSQLANELINELVILYQTNYEEKGGE